MLMDKSKESYSTLIFGTNGKLIQIKNSQITYDDCTMSVRCVSYVGYVCVVSAIFFPYECYHDCYAIKVALKQV